MDKQRFLRRDRGFSLIEVMTAVVVLATGLLALASLQGNLTRNAADARSRSQVAAAVEQVVESLRTDYASIASDGDVADVIAPPGVSDLQVAVTSTQYDGRTGTFVLYDASAGTPLQPLDPQYKKLAITATWTDSSGSDREMEFETVISPRTSGDSSAPYRSVTDGSNGALTLTERASASDVIQEGMIPIAVGDAQSAASNPKPKVFSSQGNDSRVATSFDILTYRPDGGDVIIRRRIENEVISCTCKYGAGDGTDARWPAVWNGSGYEIYAPEDGSEAPGSDFNSGTATGVVQSPECSRCCRDHHDSDAEGVAKFDPEVGTHAHYNSAGTLISPESLGIYVESCRMVRIDGLWQTAADMYSRHFGLLETESDATTGVPDEDAVASYQDFVKEYLTGYAAYDGTVGTAPANASSLFDDADRGLNEPAQITIKKAPPEDTRYLHARGLYVDYLGAAALAKMMSAVENCPDGTAAVECLLPYLPFTTINVTELAYWAAKSVGAEVDASTILSVATGSSQIYDPAEPTRGRVKAIAGNGNEADAKVSMTRSNSGVAVVLGGIDPTSDSVVSTDRQTFRIGTNSGNPGGTGESFKVRISGLPQVSDVVTNNDPAVAWTVGSESGNCEPTIASAADSPNGVADPYPNDYVCATSGALGVPATVTIAEFYRVVDANKSKTAVCTKGNGTETTATASVVTPVFYDYQVSAVSNSGTATASTDHKIGEQAIISIPNVIANDVIEVTFGADTPATIDGVIAYCTTNGGGNQIKNITWCNPWEQTCS